MRRRSPQIVVVMRHVQTANLNLIVILFSINTYSRHPVVLEIFTKFIFILEPIYLIVFIRKIHFIHNDHLEIV